MRAKKLSSRRVLTINASLLVTIILFLCSESALAQINHQWIWVSGSDKVNYYADYGTKNIAAFTNNPGPRNSEGNSWTETNGNLWLFAGNYTNDLWKYDISKNNWTWISGSNETTTQLGNYGTKGFASSSNVPGTRRGATSWTGQDGALWLWGGQYTDNSRYFSDLWKFDTEENLWTWVSGRDTLVGFASGTYGEKGVASSSNIPDVRYQALSWIDSNGDLWMFGGHSNYSEYNDLWKYDISEDQWAWISGKDGPNGFGDFGTKGVASSSNVPSGRGSAVNWVGPEGNLWLFGGIGFNSSNGLRILNDLWKYDLTSGLWTWVSGASVGEQVGVYGVQGVASSSNMPGSRYDAVSWKSPDGKLWLMGGDVYSSLISDEIEHNDVWSYDISLGEWTWEMGSNTGEQSGSVVTQGIPNSNNTPGARREALVWDGIHGFPWIMGGNGFDTSGEEGNLGDLWRLVSTPGVADFDGTSSFGKIGDSEELETGLSSALSLETWVKFDEISNTVTGENAMTLIGKGTFSFFGYGLHLGTVEGDQKLIFTHQIDSSTTIYEWPDVQADQWYHLAATYDGSEAKIFIDGELKISKNRTGAFTTNNSDLYLGYDKAFDAFYLDGKLAEVRIWNKALSQQEIQSNMILSISGKEPGLMGACCPGPAGGTARWINQVPAIT